MSGPGSPGAVTITALHGIPEVEQGANLAAILAAACARAGAPLSDGDILAVSSKIASKALGLTAATTDKERVVAGETVRVVAERAGRSGITQIVQGKAGPVMAAAGVDASNTGGRDVLLLLPHDPDAVCRDLHAALRAATGVSTFAVVLTDTAGRPWRAGQVDFALGSHGLRVLDDLRGSVDADGRALEVTVRAVADEIAAAADLVKGKTVGVPAALVRGLAGHVLTAARADSAGTDAGASTLVRVGDEDWFALGSQEAVRAALGVPPGPEFRSDVGPRPVVGDTLAGRVRRAIDVAFCPQFDRWQGGVQISAPNADPRVPGPVDWGDLLIVSGLDAFGVGVVAARLQVALRGEGVPFEVPPAPTRDAEGWWRVGFTIRGGQAR